MKKLKHIVFLLTVFLLSLFLFSCKKKEAESTPLTAEEKQSIEANISNYFQQIEAASDEGLEESIESAYKAKEEVFYNALSNFKNSRKDLGAFKEIEKVEVQKEGDYFLIDLYAKYEKRDLLFHVKLNSDYSGFKEMSFNPVYTLPEKLLSAFQNMIVGMGTVFLVLVFIAWIISLFAHVHRFEVKRAEEKKEALALRNKKNEEEKNKGEPVVTNSVAAVPVLEKEEGISEELLSVILMAAVKAYEEEEAGAKNPFSASRTLDNGLFVRSIRRRK